MKRLYSWWVGKRIGQIRWIKASPFKIGTYANFLPFDVPEDADIVYRIHEEEWTGFGWERIRLLEKTKEGLREYVSKFRKTAVEL